MSSTKTPEADEIENTIGKLLGKPFREMSAVEINEGLKNLTDSSAPILGFQGEFDFLSNFHPCRVDYEGIVYRTVEHAFQAAKTFDQVERHRIAALPKPGSAKRAGRRVRLRADWESVKIGIMEELLKLKFSDPELRGKLLATAPRIIVELNDWRDRFWGATKKQNGSITGKNLLGYLLMKVRGDL